MSAKPAMNSLAQAMKDLLDERVRQVAWWGVAIGFFVREKAKQGECGVHYAWREDAELATDKLAYLREAKLADVAFDSIAPDAKGNWINQSDSDFEQLLPLANREAKLAKTVVNEQAVFGLYSMGVVTNRDEWVYDFDQGALAPIHRRYECRGVLKG